MTIETHLHSEPLEPEGIVYFEYAARIRMFNAAAALMVATAIIISATFIYVAVQVLR